MCGTRLTVSLTMLGLLLGGCAAGQTKYAIKCPQLDPAPKTTVDALAKESQIDPATGKWVVKLDKHYQKLDQCK